MWASRRCAGPPGGPQFIWEVQSLCPEKEISKLNWREWWGDIFQAEGLAGAEVEDLRSAAV